MLVEVNERHHLIEPWDQECISGSSPPPSNLLWWKEALLHEMHQLHLHHHRRYPLAHLAAQAGRSKAAATEWATSDGDTERLWVATRIRSKSHELALFPFLFRLQQMAIGNKNNVRDGLGQRGYLCGGGQGCEPHPCGTYPKTSPMDPQEMSQHAAMHDCTFKGAIKSRGNRGGRPSPGSMGGATLRKS